MKILNCFVSKSRKKNCWFRHLGCVGKEDSGNSESCGIIRSNTTNNQYVCPHCLQEGGQPLGKDRDGNWVCTLCGYEEKDSKGTRYYHKEGWENNSLNYTCKNVKNENSSDK